MKHRFSIFALLLLTAASIFANGSVENRDGDWLLYPRLKDFDEIELRTASDLVLKQGNDWDVRVRGSRSDIEDLDLYVSGNTLVIRNESIFNFMSSGSRVEIEVTLPVLRRIELSGSGRVSSRNAFECRDLELKSSGSGDLEFEAIADALDCRISGSGEMEFRGRSNSLKYIGTGSGKARFDIRTNLAELKLSGTGGMDLRGEAESMKYRGSGTARLDADRFPVQYAEVTLTGTGNADINVEKELEVKLTGTGSVYYRGECSITDFSASGPGRIHRR